VAAVSRFHADAGAHLVPLNQHSTQQTGGMFIQRTIFHLSGLVAARNVLASGFAE
jgi:formyltetrahydrofolate deformylase